MRKVIVLLLMTALVMGVVVLAGCGEKKVTVTDEESGESYTAEEIDAEDLGIPVYPGAKLQEDAAASVTTKGEDGSESGAFAIMETKDSVSDVVAWYKDKLSGETGFTDTSMAIEGTEVGMFAYEDGDQFKSVIVGSSDETGMTEIVLSSSSEDMTLPGSTE